MLGGVDGGPWAVGGGLEVRLFFLGLFGESGEPPVPGLKSAAKVLLFVTPDFFLGMVVVQKAPHMHTEAAGRVGWGASAGLAGGDFCSKEQRRGHSAASSTPFSCF